jgi:MerR family transcriptional regulator, light-induced transcriptional regulator
MTADEARVQIGELSRRVGVGADTLRAWERRYGLLRPARSAGGFRLYSGDDERRVRAMQAQLDRGVPAAQAARAVLSTGPAVAPPDARARLTAALGAYDEGRAHTVLDRLLDDHGPEVALRDVVYPYLRDVGDGWASGELDVGQEHFASNLLLGRLLALLRSLDAPAGPPAVLACPPGELHTLGLAGHGVALSRRAWRVVFLGADTPIAMIAGAADSAGARAVVLSAVNASRFAAVETELAALARRAPLALAGAGAEPAFAHRIGAALLRTDPVTAAAELAQLA